MPWFAKFLASKVSGWIAILAVVALMVVGTGVGKIIYDYKELQRKAAYCEGRLSMMDLTKALSERAIDQINKNTEDAVEELEDIRDESKENAPIDEEGITIEPQGCAGARAPDAILRYHGLRD